VGAEQRAGLQVDVAPVGACASGTQPGWLDALGCPTHVPWRPPLASTQHPPPVTLSHTRTHTCTHARMHAHTHARAHARHARASPAAARFHSTSRHDAPPEALRAHSDGGAVRQRALLVPKHPSHDSLYPKASAPIGAPPEALRAHGDGGAVGQRVLLVPKTQAMAACTQGLSSHLKRSEPTVMVVPSGSAYSLSTTLLVLAAASSASWSCAV